MSVSDSFLSYYKIEYSSLCIWFFFKSAYSSVSFRASYTYRFYMFFHLFQSLTSFLSLSLFFPRLWLLIKGVISCVFREFSWWCHLWNFYLQASGLQMKDKQTIAHRLDLVQYFLKIFKILLEDSHTCLFTHCLFASVLQLQSWAVATVTGSPTMPKIFTLWPFTWNGLPTSVLGYSQPGTTLYWLAWDLLNRVYSENVACQPKWGHLVVLNSLPNVFEIRPYCYVYE